MKRRRESCSTHLKYDQMLPSRYVMLTIDQTPCGWDNRSRVFEFAIYGSAPPAGVTTASAIPNVAIGKQTASSTYVLRSMCLLVCVRVRVCVCVCVCVYGIFLALLILSYLSLVLKSVVLYKRY